MTEIAAVVIGRNEGDRLIACLRSLEGHVARVVYVDSGSTDGSPEAARTLGAEIVALDMNVPFTAARARNAGLEVLAATPAGLCPTRRRRLYPAGGLDRDRPGFPRDAPGRGHCLRTPARNPP